MELRRIFFTTELRQCRNCREAPRRPTSSPAGWIKCSAELMRRERGICSLTHLAAPSRLLIVPVRFELNTPMTRLDKQLCPEQRARILINTPAEKTTALQAFTTTATDTIPQRYKGSLARIRSGS